MYGRLSFALSVGLFLVGASVLLGQSYGSGAYYIVDFAGDRLANTPVAGASVSIGNPTGIATDSAGNVYIADSGNFRVRKVSNGVITTVAGNGTGGFSGDNGPATNAQLTNPTNVAVDPTGNLYIADSGNHRIRKVTAGTISTFAGTAGMTRAPRQYSLAQRPALDPPRHPHSVEDPQNAAPLKKAQSPKHRGAEWLSGARRRRAPLSVRSAPRPS